MKKKAILLFITAFIVAASALPTTAQADTAYEYIDADGTLKTTTAPVTVLSGSGAGETLASGWYIVLDAGVTRSSTVIISGDVYLILADGASLSVTPSSNQPGVSVTTANSLTVYGQPLGTGELSATGVYGCAGIGTRYSEDGGTVTINGGTITANGGNRGAGIGGNTININGGTVTATGGSETHMGEGTGAGIGGNRGCAGGTINISGGTVSATGGSASFMNGAGAGIGGGGSAAGGTVSISGGTITAQGGNGIGTTSGAGIGGGGSGAGGSVYISGGSVKAIRGGSGAEDIGTGEGGSGGTLTNKPISEGGVSVFSTTVKLNGITAKMQITSLTASAEGYGLHDVFTDASGNIYLYLTQGAATITAQTPIAAYSGYALTAETPSVFTFVEAALAEREIELRTGGGQVQWRYKDETEWRNLVALSDITGPQGQTGAAGMQGQTGAAGMQGQTGAAGMQGQTGAAGMQGQTGATGKQGSMGSAGSDGTDGINGANGMDGNGIESIKMTSTNGNVDTYTIAFTNGGSTTFTVKNGQDGVGVVSGVIDEKGGLVLTLADGTKLDTGQLTSDAIPAKSSTDSTALIALTIAGVAVLSHLGWLIPLLLRRKRI